jgi:uncharacterized protein (TIGR02266 family)
MGESKKVERRLHFRGKARAGRRVELTYERLGAAADTPSTPSSTVTANIGVGGAFILTDDPAPVGSRLTIELRIPTTQETLHLRAEVRWARQPKPGRAGAGMGVKFLGLDVESLLALSEYFASLTGEEV